MSKGQNQENEQDAKGTVIRSTGSWYNVKMADGTILDCRLRGKFRIEGIKTTNPIAVGDHVIISSEDGDNVITEILPRKNYVLRKSINLSKRAHILCANIDQAIVLFTIDHPVTTLGYVDRLLVTCEAYHIPVILVFNKIDVLDEKDQEKLKDYMQTYRSIGYDCKAIVGTDPRYSEEIRGLLKDKVSFVVGRSGAGKSTLVNLADPDLELKVGDVSDWSGRGKHTTTFAEMHELSFGGQIIDSPGFKEMTIFDFEKAELSHYFPDMRPYLDDCKFSNCIHVKEPGCGVKAAVADGLISESRYHTYLGMLDEVEAPGW